jgi:hypothetical protein
MESGDDIILPLQQPPSSSEEQFRNVANAVAHPAAPRFMLSTSGAQAPVEAIISLCAALLPRVPIDPDVGALAKRAVEAGYLPGPSGATKGKEAAMSSVYSSSEGSGSHFAHFADGGREVLMVAASAAAAEIGGAVSDLSLGATPWPWQGGLDFSGPVATVETPAAACTDAGDFSDATAVARSTAATLKDPQVGHLAAASQDDVLAADVSGDEGAWECEVCSATNSRTAVACLVCTVWRPVDQGAPLGRPACNAAASSANLADEGERARRTVPPSPLVLTRDPATWLGEYTRDLLPALVAIAAERSSLCATSADSLLLILAPAVQFAPVDALAAVVRSHGRALSAVLLALVSSARATTVATALRVATTLLMRVPNIGAPLLFREGILARCSAVAVDAALCAAPALTGASQRSASHCAAAFSAKGGSARGLSPASVRTNVASGGVTASDPRFKSVVLSLVLTRATRLAMAHEVISAAIFEARRVFFTTSRAVAVPVGDVDALRASALAAAAKAALESQHAFGVGAAGARPGSLGAQSPALSHQMRELQVFPSFSLPLPPPLNPPHPRSSFI